ncbi:hypothetical protein [Hymenobacter metallicola]|uniref:Uncharacterized protein n=1 Tax=Hymenobacter metallicola TaxID=2563114 RepID=A0A4Z0Q956_9BACT|nr:hypothetical protein [Hymenobacter metallicola]TGE26540.1 hypothetical protein E5K02_17260 [Hymenobacter metallicola]
MPRTATTLTIAKPCAESWQQMSPVTPQSRHCAACCEVVADFTQMSDGEIMHFLRHNPAVSCGRFTEGQLGRQLQQAPLPAPRWRTWLAATATVLGLREAAALESRAQKANLEVADIPRPVAAGSWSFSPADELTKQETREQQASEMATPEGRITVRGTVHNRWGLPLAKARVRLYGQPDYVAKTNALGHFVLELPASLVTPEAELWVSRLWHRSQSVGVASSPARRYHFFLKRRSRRIISGKFR